MSEPEHEDDLLGLPMFDSQRPAPVRRPGRVRGGFRVPDEPTSDTPAVPSRVVPIRPAPSGSVFGSASPAVDGVDWTEVARFRGEVAKRLPGRVGGVASREREEAEGWSVIRQLLDEDTKAANRKLLFEQVEETPEKTG